MFAGRLVVYSAVGLWPVNVRVRRDRRPRGGGDGNAGAFI